MSAQDFPRAETAIRKLLVADPDDVSALLLAGRIAEQRDDPKSSLAFYQEAILKSTSPNTELLDQLTISMVKSGRIFDAIELLKTFILKFEDVPSARMDLAGLAAMVGVPEVAVPRLHWLFQHNQGDMESLMMMANLSRVEPDVQFCEQLLLRTGTDTRVCYAKARLDAMNGDWDAVAEQLAPVIARYRNFVPGWVLYGRALVELNRLSDLARWQESLPPEVANSPEYWIVIGKWAEASGKHELAAQAFLNVQNINETDHPDYLDGLYRSLIELQHEQGSRLVEQQIERHLRLRDSLKIYLGRKKQSQSAAFHVAEAMVDLGRIWEAEAWARHAVILEAEPVGDAKARYLNIRSKLKVGDPWILPEKSLVNAIVLNGDVDFGELLSGSVNARQPRSTALRVKSRCPTFRDEANMRRFLHTCEISPRAETEGRWIHQTLGGGVGVIDYDLDSLPDIAAAMLDGQPSEADSSPNRLFRNLGDHFVEIGRKAGFVDTGFSHGITVGDTNDDGFPDIFDANYGQNRLFINNGDGTFREVAQEVGLINNAWTVSAAIADLDNDGNADLYTVNYCDGTRPFEQPCLEGDRKVACAPLQFNAQMDRVWRGVGDGNLVDASMQWMDQAAPGRGMGLVVGQLDEVPGLDVYVTNDMTANHLWSSRTSNGTFRLIDFAPLRGVAVSGNSQSQGSMGVALGDPDNDGDFDFYVTNFVNEHYTHYEQTQPGFWSDHSLPSGLAQPTIALTGFGTKWCDFDNDGAQELAIANGHTDDFRESDVPFHMTGQVFRRNPSGRWEECDRNELGEYFGREHVGRTLAIADIDCDGRNDLLISHLHEPVAMLMNRTENTGHSIRFVLKGVTTQRDAIGATVSVTAGNRTTVAMVTSGDGYMCSNERKLSFGLGSNQHVHEVTVRWPTGRTQTFEGLKSDNEYLLVEGDEAFISRSL